MGTIDELKNKLRKKLSFNEIERELHDIERFVKGSDAYRKAGEFVMDKLPPDLTVALFAGWKELEREGKETIKDADELYVLLDMAKDYLDNNNERLLPEFQPLLELLEGEQS